MDRGLFPVAYIFQKLAATTLDLATDPGMN
jgi:hypothetical protein